MLYCEKCKDEDNIERKGTVYKVLRSQYTVDGTACVLTIRRRRKCLVCDHRWTTLEVNKDKFIKR